MTNISQNNPWFAYIKSNPHADLRLFCFPFAGGSAMTYRTWSDFLPTNIEVCPVELPGRGSRMREQAYTKIKPLVQNLSEALVSYLDRPYVFFGHSMGALIGFELVRLFRGKKLPLPAHFFVSGHIAPQVESHHDPIFNLPDEAFREELLKLDGTPEPVLNNDELMRLLLPMLRADFELNETYAYEPDDPLECPITVYGGIHDNDVDRKSLEAWQEQTSAKFSIQMFAGGHFFFQTEQSVVLQVLSHQLKAIVAEL